MLALLLILSPSPAQNPPDRKMDEQLKALAARVEALEKAVLRDPLHPTRPVIARLDAGEQRLSAIEKHQAETHDFDRRLTSVETQQRQAVRDAVDPRDLRELQRKVDRLTKGLDDLKQRLQKLESKR